MSLGIAISSASSLAAASTGDPQGTATAASMKVELRKLEREHAACVNCSSASTDAGQRNIQRLEIQIEQIKSRLSVPSTQSADSVNAPVSSTARPGSVDIYA